MSETQNKFMLQSARDLKPRLKDDVTSEGFDELISKMPTLRKVGFICVDTFLTDKGSDTLAKDPDGNSDIKINLKELFHRLCQYDAPQNRARSRGSNWSLHTASRAVAVQGHFYNRHTDPNATHTFLLNPKPPTAPMSYEVWPDKNSDVPVSIPITASQLVVLDGWNDRFEGKWVNTPHRIDSGAPSIEGHINAAEYTIPIIDDRVRIMYYE